MSVAQSTPLFILSRHWRETDRGIELRFWLSGPDGPQCWQLDGQDSVCFVAEQQVERWQSIWLRQKPSIRQTGKSFQTLMGETAVPVYSRSFSQQRRWAWQGKEVGLKVWEEDINPAERYLMERFLFGSLQFSDQRARPAHSEPTLRPLSIDIETTWFEPGKTPDLYSVALAGKGLGRVYLIDQGQSRELDPSLDVLCFETTKDCLEAVINAITAYDPDCLVGWNVVDFDLRILQNHCDRVDLAFTIGRNSVPAVWRARTDHPERYYLEVEGRQIIDGPGAFRSAAWSFDDFSLETVAQTLLQRGKKIEHSDDRVNEIERLYRDQPDAFVQYNLADAQLVLDLFERAGLWHFLIERSHLTGLAMDRVGGSSAAFNTVYMPRLHRRGYIAANVGEQQLQTASPGGFVMDSIPGIYRNVLVLDFKSLYPAIIRTFLIDPLGLREGLSAPLGETVPGFLDARFHRQKHILPALIDQLWQARDQAKAEHNAPMSQAIKIIMNSFYGVLGSNLCRFFDPRLASSITLRGHEILQKSRDFIEAKGYRVIYGDTDSVFVHAAGHCDPEQLGQQLAAELNHWWQDRLRAEFGLVCHLEMEFETHYEQFVMPTIRGTETGSKKRYAGWQVRGGEHQLVFKGLEAVRSDWTLLAKRFQQSLYERVFRQQPYKSLITETVLDLQAGKLDSLLVYKRRLRRSIEQYDKQKPPHVQAAWLKRQQQPHWRGQHIEYVKTVQGWQPLGYITARLDYQHYIDKQLAPIADALLHFLSEDFYSLIDDQLSLF
jgi:DNA polymerase-2